jgi:hypothetical protein
MPQNPAKPSFSVRVENTPKSRFDCQNEGDLPLAKSLPMALELG